MDRIILVVSALDTGEHAVPAGGLIAVDVAFRRAEIAGPGHGGGDHDFLDVPLQPAAGYFLIALHTVAGDAVLDLEILLFGDFLEGIAGVELGKLKERPILPGRVWQRVCQDGTGDVPVGLDAVGGEILLTVVRRMAHEGVVILQSQLLGGGVQPEINRERGLGKLLRVHHLQIALRNLRGINHAVEHHMRHQVRDDPFTRKILAGLQLYAAHSVVSDINPADFCVVPHISAQLPDPGVKGHGDFMAAVFGKPGKMRQVHIGHIGVDGKAHVGGIGGDIGPVGLEDPFRFLRDADPVQHLLRRDRHHAHQVIVLEQHFHLGRGRGLVVVSSQPVDPVV